MSEFSTYLQLGFEHISDVNAYDHIVFIIALTAVYRLKELKKIFWLVTSFTLGHSVSLALATLKIVIVNSAVIEFLIPVTILITAILNVSRSQETTLEKRLKLSYVLASFFGIIHGMGFSNYLQALLGTESNILLPLLSFNLGLEIGQLMIVSFILMALVIGERILKIKHREWALFLSGAAAGIAIILINETKFW